ncbi:MAG: Nif3-like dinuclear metal center hexameric protein [Bacteroidales bacterium]|nr:Nif3-like dinuclear metal center hexameric protein [Candidatus Colimorpha onthohippi]
MNIKEVITFLDAQFHPEYQESYDNSGYLLGDPNQPYQGALVAVDLTSQIIAEAIEHKLNLIVTHHPFIFNGIKRITTGSETGRMIHQLIQNGISVYAVHTNLDNLPDGVNGILAQKLGLTQCSILKPIDGHTNIGAGMVGMLPQPMPTEQFIQHVKQVLILPIVRSSALCRNEVQRVAICGGSGSFLIGDAIQAHADIFLTSDLKYHEFEHVDGRIVLLDAGHYESEQFSKEIIYTAISKKFSTFACRISCAPNSFICYH